MAGGEAKLAKAKIAERAARRAERGRSAPRTLDSLRAIMMIRAYRMRGHLRPTSTRWASADRQDASELDPASYGFAESRLSTAPIFLDYVLGLETATLREILAILRRTYCGNVGVQYMHISDPNEKAWLQQRIEGRDKEIAFTPEGKIAILKKLIETESFERFLRQALPRHQALRPGRRRGDGPGAGADHQARRRAGRAGHRHRHAAPRPAERAGRGDGQALPRHLPRVPGRLVRCRRDIEGSGDVKYHLGASSDRELRRQQRSTCR